MPFLIGPQPDCQECPLHHQCDSPRLPRSVGIPTRFLEDSLPPSPGESIPAILYVGRNPGFHEDEQSTCFVGRSGKLLHRVYLGGIKAHTRASIYLTNAVRCHTLGDESPRAPAYKGCLPYFLLDLWSLLRHHDRLLLIALGGESTGFITQRVMGGKKLSLQKGFSSQGLPFPLGLHTAHVFFTYHPAAVLRKPTLINAVHSHNQLILDFLNGVMATPSTPNILPYPVSPERLVGIDRGRTHPAFVER